MFADSTSSSPVAPVFAARRGIAHTSPAPTAAAARRTRCHRIEGVRVRHFDTSGAEIEDPAENERNREADRQEDDQQAGEPIGETDDGESGAGHFDDEPGDRQVRHGDPPDAPALQADEKPVEAGGGRLCVVVFGRFGHIRPHWRGSAGGACANVLIGRADREGARPGVRSD
jgi:hypothetical protein